MSDPIVEGPYGKVYCVNCRRTVEVEFHDSAPTGAGIGKVLYRYHCKTCKAIVETRVVTHVATLNPRVQRGNVSNEENY